MVGGIEDGFLVEQFVEDVVGSPERTGVSHEGVYFDVVALQIQLKENRISEDQRNFDSSFARQIPDEMDALDSGD